MLNDFPAAARRHVRRRFNAARSGLGPPAEVQGYLDAHRGATRLNLGCGRVLLPGWLNTDRDPAPGAVALDITRRFGLPDAVFDHVLAEHVIEHVELDAGRRMLAECARVLRPGGRVRVSTPDLTRIAGLCFPGRDAAAERYATWAAGAFAPGAAGSTGAIVLNHAMRGWDHRFLHDEETLTRALRDAGFDDVRRHLYRASPDAAFAAAEGRGVDAIGIEMRTWETLALEAVRP